MPTVDIQSIKGVSDKVGSKLEAGNVTWRVSALAEETTKSKKKVELNSDNPISLSKIYSL